MDIADTERLPPAPHRSREPLSREAIVTISVLVASTFTVILNSLMMAVALPRVMADLDITASTAQWLTTGYMLTMAIVIPATGFLTERYQMRTVFTLAMTFFTVGTIVAILAPGFSVLLGGRIIQAVGTAIVLPLSYTAMSSLVPASRRGSVMAMNIVATSAAPALGPVFSGLILSRFDWHWLFIAILPLAIGTLAFGNAAIRVVSVSRKVSLDALSMVLSAAGFAGLVYGLASLGKAAAHALVSPWLSMPVGVAIVATFVARQIQLQKADRAQLDMRPFAVRTFSVSAFTMLCFMIASYGMMTLMPVILQTSYGFSAVQAGLFMVPGGITIAVVSAIIGRVYDRVGARPLVVAGAMIDAAGLCALSTLPPSTPIGLLLGAYLFTIVGQALMWTPLFAASLGVLSKHLLPHGSAIVNTLQQLAGAAGIAVMFSIMSATSESYIQSGEPAGAAMAQGAQWAYLTGFGFVLVSLAAALFLPRRHIRSSVPLHVRR